LFEGEIVNKTDFQGGLEGGGQESSTDTPIWKTYDLLVNSIDDDD
jgi:hypothetical protein